MNRYDINRRRALTLLVAGSASVAAGVTGWVTGLGAPGGKPAWVQSGQTLTEPAVLGGHAGALEVSLTAAAGAPIAGHASAALGFNATSPGPTLRVHPGDVLKVRLINRLTQPTNLHTHGLHVSPQGNGDNPFVSIAPGAAFDYEFAIPEGHPSGTFWYHPHHHPFVADQLFGGLAGALIVDGGPDLGVGAERIMLVSDITLDDNGGVAAVNAMERMMGRQGQLVLVNGQHQPLISAEPGVAQRWRLINACTSRVLSIHLEGHRLTHIARDGYFLPSPLELDRIALAPGNRADLVITPAAPGRYTLITEPYDRGNLGMGMGGMGGMCGMGSAAASGPITLGTVEVSGPSRPATPVPNALPAPQLPTGAVTVQRTLTFAMQMGMMQGGMMSFTIDGKGFDPQRIDQSVRLDSTEEWLVSNTSSLAHPFHLHVWPVQVLATSDDPTPEPTLRDVVLVPPRGWARLRIQFADFAGRSVYHCHILDHEDAGMMGTVQAAHS